MDNVGIQIDQMIRKLKRKPQAHKRFCDYQFATDEATNIVLDTEITPHMLHAVPGDVLRWHSHISQAIECKQCGANIGSSIYWHEHYGYVCHGCFIKARELIRSGAKLFLTARNAKFPNA